jgi:GTP cyclohydrolase II
MRVLSAPRRLSGLSGFGLDVVEYVEIEHPGASSEGGRGS